MKKKLNGKTFFNTKRYHKIPSRKIYSFILSPSDSPMTTKLTAKVEEDNEHSDSSGFCDSREVSQPTSPRSPTISQPKAHYQSVIGPPASFHKPIVWSVPPLTLRHNSYDACSNFSRSAGSLSTSSSQLPAAEILYTPTPLFESYAGETVQQSSEYRFWDNQRHIFPRIPGSRRPKSIDEIVANLLTFAEQDFIIANSSVDKYMKCMTYIRNLFSEVSGNVSDLPRTIIYTSTMYEATKIALYLNMHFQIPISVAPENASHEELKEIFSKCESREIPILVFQDRIFSEGVNNIDLAINYSLPAKAEQYARRLNCLVHKKCVSFISSEQDKELIQHLYKIVNARGRKIPKSLLTAFERINAEQNLREFKVADSWLDLVDEEEDAAFICDNKLCFYCYPQYYEGEDDYD